MSLDKEGRKKEKEKRKTQTRMAILYRGHQVVPCLVVFVVFLEMIVSHQGFGVAR